MTTSHANQLGMNIRLDDGVNEERPGVLQHPCDRGRDLLGSLHAEGLDSIALRDLVKAELGLG